MATSHINSRMARKTVKGGTSIINDDIGFDLERLFDQYNMDHIPFKHRLDTFAQRDLPHIKHYKAAVNIFGGPISRKRVIIAPPMETPQKRKLGLYMNQRQDPPAPVLNNAPKPSEPPPKVMSSAEVLDLEETEKESGYKKWFSERQALRENLDGMGLSEKLLQRKSNKSELEKRVETRMRAARLWKPESPPPPEPEPVEKEPPVVPSMKVPVPTALQILDKFLTDKKMRLIDLYRNADRNNDWKLTKEELLAAVKKYDIPLTNSDVDDLMVTLDHNFDEHLDFKEVSQGLAALKAERRAAKRQDTASGSKKSSVRQPSPVSKMSSTISGDMNTNQNHSDTRSVNHQKVDPHQGKESAVDYTAEDVGETEAVQTEKRSGSGSGSRSASRSGSGSAHRSRSATPNSLEPPPPDTREERRMGSSAEEMLELRKHDKTVLERAKMKKWPEKKVTHDEIPGVIRIGHKDVDNHCMESTLEGDVGDLMNQFRRNCLKEYFHAIRICQEKGIVLSPELLDRVLLYPAELPRHQIMKKLAPPKGPLSGLQEDFARPPKKPKTPPEIRHKDKMKRSKNGSLMIDVRHMYPPMVKVAPVVTKENLSTGRALVSRRSDIWMTFEEYDKYTKHLPRRYKKLNITIRPDSEEGDTSNITGYTRSANRQQLLGGYQLDAEKFWPGYMLDKLAMFEPSVDQPAPWSDGSSAIFHSTKQPKRGNTGHVKVLGPPVWDDGRIVNYGIDKHRMLLPTLKAGHERKG